MNAPDIRPPQEARTRTDYQIPLRWVWTQAASYVLWAAVPLVGDLYQGQLGIEVSKLVGILGLAGFVCSALASYLVYQLVSRRNLHFAREEMLFADLLYSAQAKAGKADIKTQITLESAERDLAKLSELGKEHSAILWSTISLIPYLSWIALIYVLSFVTQDIKRHEQREDLVIEDFSRFTPGVPMRSRRIPNRPVVAYAALSVLGPMVLYTLRLAFESILFPVLALAALAIVQLLWLVQAVRDPDSHFVFHRSFESILSQKSVTQSPGASC